MMIRQVDFPYLWLPVTSGGEKYIVTIDFEEKRIHEIELEYSGRTDWYAWIDLSEFLGKKIEINSENETILKNVRTCPKKPAVKSEGRPEIHFTAESGWINDPNGLFYKDGKWNLYFQHNPYGISWGNMHWGHAVSTDLIHWSQKKEAIYPNENGTAFSGCAIVDHRNGAGLGKEAVIYYYTGATNCTTWKSEKGYAQYMKYSVDEGLTLQDCKEGIVPMIAEDNRDPKIFWDEDDMRYVMLLYLKKNDFAILTSNDLRTWSQLQTLTLSDAWECPNLFRLKVEGKWEETKWVFWTADGFYYIGDFGKDGFTIEEGKKKAYVNELPYAAQNYSDTGSRTILQPWLRVKNQGKAYTGIMGIPVELSLRYTGKGHQILMLPAHEIESCRRKKVLPEPNKTNGERWYELDTEGALEIDITNTSKKSATDISRIKCYGQAIEIDWANNFVKIACSQYRTEQAGPKNTGFRIFADYGAVEIFSKDGSFYVSEQWELSDMKGTVCISEPEDMETEIEIYGFKRDSVD